MVSHFLPPQQQQVADVIYEFCSLSIENKGRIPTTLRNLKTILESHVVNNEHIVRFIIFYEKAAPVKNPSTSYDHTAELWGAASFDIKYSSSSKVSDILTQNRNHLQKIARGIRVICIEEQINQASFAVEWDATVNDDSPFLREVADKMSFFRVRQAAEAADYNELMDSDEILELQISELGSMMDIKWAKGKRRPVLQEA